MSCVPITPEMSHLLEACQSWPLTPENVDELQATPDPEHVHGRGVDYLAGCEECRTINRAYYPRQPHPTRTYKRKKA
jgi:hypothetical protein